MAKDKASEKVYTIPLRREWVKQSRIKRANKCISVIREYLEKHTKASEIKISAGVNEHVWFRGIKKPPGKIKVTVRLEEGVAFARLPEEKIPEKKKEKEEKKETVKKREEPKKETSKEEAKKEKPKEEPKIEKAEKPGKTLSKDEKEAEELWKEAEKKAKEGKD